MTRYADCDGPKQQQQQHQAQRRRDAARPRHEMRWLRSENLLSCFLIDATASDARAQFTSHHRPVPVFLTIDVTLANAPAVSCGDLSAFFWH
jgi:ferric-dicitrate binding protein FerR (iron transport regulator)